MVALDKQKLLTTLHKHGFDALIEEGQLKLQCTLENGEAVELQLALSPAARYHLPEFSFSTARHPALSVLPHVSPNGNICTLDQTSNEVHPDRWEEAVADIAHLAVEVLNDGLKGVNVSDYDDELQAYWALGIDCASQSIAICEEPTSNSEVLIGSYGSFKPGHLFLALSKEVAKDYARKANGGKEPVDDAISCLYLRLRKALTFPLPKTVRQWRKEIAKSGTDLVNSYETFAATCEKKAFIVVCSVPTARGRVLLSFSSPTPKVAVNGFRPGRVPIEYALVRNDFGGKEISRRDTVNLRQERLFSRGGNGLITNESCLIIGCGSLGSNLARTLCDSGYKNLTLVDNDYLSIDNIARHACGFESVGLPKTNAIKTALEQSNPNITCEARREDANIILDDSLALNRFCAAFVTAADAPLELHAVRAKTGGNLECPLILMWLEPYGLAGHALVLNKSQDVFQDLFNDDLTFRNCAVINSSNFYKREAGCQSTYIPYSGADAQKFVLDFLTRWRMILSQRPDCNYHFIWLGRQ